uniref:Uncharacterized protein n=1 Tax=Jaculus jaculus TaxID=51337 RepID=A0A8C5NWI2_JACJA
TDTAGMRPPRLALLLLLLLQGGCLLAAARREPGTAGPASGRFVSREQLACSWQLVPGAAGSSELAVRCSRGRPRQPPSAPHPDGKIKTPAGRRKAGPDPARERDMATGPNPDGLDANARLTETYCAEKWHSLCNFFVNFWNG